MKSFCLLFALAFLVSSCGEIKQYNRVSQPVDAPLIAGVGDVILQIDKEESMPNIVGKADIWGRTRPTAKIFVSYLGLDGDRAVFDRRTIQIQSNATTMNSTPIFVSQSSTTRYSETTSVVGTVPGGIVPGTGVTTGTATTTAPPIVIPPSGSTTQVISADRVRYYLDLTGDRTLLVEGNEILIEEAKATRLQYRIKRWN